jgi:hypothetical protein
MPVATIDQRAGLDRHRLQLELRGHGFEQRPIELVRDQQPAQSDEGGSFRCRLVRSEPAKTAEGGAILQRLGQLHVRQIVPDGQQKGSEHRQRRPSRFALGSRIEGSQMRIYHAPID